MGDDGHECPGYCPTKCGPDEMPCSGGRDMNNCDLPEICVPMKGGLWLNEYSFLFIHTV